MERLRAALENLDQAIDMAESALERRNKSLDRIVEEKALKRIKTASDTADNALRQARSRESKSREAANAVAGRLDQAILRLEKMVGG